MQWQINKINIVPNIEESKLRKALARHFIVNSCSLELESTSFAKTFIIVIVQHNIGAQTTDTHHQCRGYLVRYSVIRQML
jgi:hypothetical protein